MNKELKGKSGIYVIRNLINNKVYIGSAVDLYNRKSHHFLTGGINTKHNKYLSQSFKKHGVNNFIFEVLHCVDKEDLLSTETKYIQLFESYKPNIGYNILSTGGSNLGMKHSVESKQKMSELKTRFSVVQLTKSGEFVADYISANEAQRKTGIEHSNIIDSCNRNLGLAKGFLWIYKNQYDEMSKDELTKLIEENKNKNNTEKRVVIQMTKDGVFLKKYESAREAERITTIPNQNISKACQGKLKSAGGFKWLYE